MRNWRKIHGLVALLITLPLMAITLTGIALQLRDQFEFIQPSLVKAVEKSPTKSLTLTDIEAKFPGLDQVVYRPAKGSLIVRFKDGYEKQIHPETGAILKEGMRRTNFLIEIHQGSWMGRFGQYILHFTAGLGLLFLILSGLYIYPFKRKTT